MHESEVRAAIRAEVRSYLRSAAARYVPMVALALSVVLLLVVVPDRQQPSNSSFPGQSGLGTGASPTPGSGPGGVTPTLGPGASGPGVTGGGGTVPGTGLPGGTGTGPGGSPGGTTGPSASGGVAVSGVTCTAGARQFTWSPYAPMCMPRYTGPNPGATAHGVTKSDITIVLRKPTDWDSLASSTNTATFSQIVQDTTALVGYFNTQYELYGRKVVVKTFDGKGSFLSEGAGQGQATAGADAQTEYDMGAFADGFPFSVGAYSQQESAHHIVHFAPGTSTAAYKANAPYQFGLPAGPVNEIQGTGVASYACQRLAGMKAVFAGDAATRASTRKFAVLEPDSSDFAGGAAALVSEMKRECGVTPKVYRYSTDVTTEAQQAVQIVGQLKADSNTTVLMLTDPVMVQFMTQQASQQQYNPEWVFTILSTVLARQADAKQMAHAMELNPWHATTQAPADRLCHRIYKLARPSGSPASDPGSLDTVCSMMLAFFSALQQAGPNLTPAQFYQQWFTQPASKGPSDFGVWEYGPQNWSPDATFTVTWWNPAVTSKYDGGAGQFQTCGSLVDARYVGARLGSGQPPCFKS
ncbi:MAG: hypothetical protein QOK42_1085 [Frankiaceae bacterium]|nr:hypothetical protein [Frankiaceae bacterium]